MDRKRKVTVDPQPSTSHSKGDELIKESIELINKMKQQSSNKYSVNLNDRHVSQEQIVQLFIETSDKIDKCIDFKIHEWLEKYESFKEEPNFHQAALLIINAAQIYGRKVDYLEEIVLHMDSDRRKQLEKQGKPMPDKPRRTRKRYRPDTDALDQPEYKLKDFKPVPLTKITENLRINSMKNKNFLEKHKFLSQKYGGKGKSKVNMRLTSRIAAGKDSSSGMNTYTSFGNKVYIYDYEMDEIIGSRSDFKVYTNIIHDETSELLNDYDFTQYFEHVDSVDEAIENEERQRDELKQKGLPIPPRKNHSGPRKIKLYLSRSYLKAQYDINLNEDDDDIACDDDNHFDAGACISDANITEFHDLAQTTRVEATPRSEESLFVQPPKLDAISGNETDSAYESMAEQSSSIDSSVEASNIAMDQLAKLANLSSNQTDAGAAESTTTSESVTESVNQTGDSTVLEETVTEASQTINDPEKTSDEAAATMSETVASDDVTILEETVTENSETINDPEKTVVSDEAVASNPVDGVVEEQSDPSAETSTQDTPLENDMEPTDCSENLEIPAASMDVSTESTDVSAEMLADAPADEMPPPPLDDLLLDDEVCQINSQDDKRISLDEGIDCSNLPTPVKISDMNETDWAKLTPKLELIDILHPINKYMDLSMENLTFIEGSSTLNFLGIDEVYLTQREHFQLPLTMLVKETEIKLNFLGLPESKLKRKSNFMLPLEMLPKKKELCKYSAVTQARIMRILFNLHESTPGILTPPSTPTMEDDEEFLGFEAYGVENTSFDDNDLLSSTLQNPQLEAIKETDPAKPFTPTRTLSRDSGITSPTPMLADELDKQVPSDKSAEELVESKIEENTEVQYLDDIEQCQDDDHFEECVAEPTLEPSPEVNSETVVPVEAEKTAVMTCMPETPEPEPTPAEEAIIKKLSERDTQLAKVAQDKYHQQVSDMNTLVKKVNQWHAHLKPILKESEKRNHFDIHEYGSKIIDCFPKEYDEERLKRQRPSISFGQMMETKGRDYTARYFLSTLQLVNTNNVKLIADAQNPRKITPVQNIHLQLLSRVRHHQEMDNISDNLDRSTTIKPTNNKNKKATNKRKRTNNPANYCFENEEIAPADKRIKFSAAPTPDEDMDFMKKLKEHFPKNNSDEAIKRRIDFKRNLRRLANNDEGFEEDEEIDDDDYQSCEDGYAGDVSTNTTPQQPNPDLLNRPSTSRVVQWQQQIALSFNAAKPTDTASVADSGYLSTTMTNSDIQSFTGNTSNILHTTMLSAVDKNGMEKGIQQLSCSSSDEEVLRNNKRTLEGNDSAKPEKYLKT